MNINGSPDISVLQIQPTFDISGNLPIVSIVNLSVGSNLAGITWWFVLTSPSGTFIHQGSFAAPDIVGTWTNFSITNSWPRPFNQIEWSGAPYNLTVFIQDSIGNQYSDNNYNATICRPNGNNPTSKTFYGISDTSVQVKCDQARIFFEDHTNHSYRGLYGTLVASVLRMVYPIDETGSIPAPFVINDFSVALVPISYSSDTYQFQASSIYDYDFGGFVHVRIRYQSLSRTQASFITFPVLCNIDLCPLVCEFTKLIDSVENGSCSDVQEAERKISLISPKILLAQIGKQEPLCGIDVPALIQNIQEIGGFQCDCCNAPTGIIPNTASIVDGFTFSIVPVCGDINGTVTTTGTNIQFNLQDKSYVFAFNNSSTSAFTVTNSTSACTKTYTLNVNLTTLSTDILNTIKNNGTLVNLFNSIVIPGSSIDLIVDGGCIFQSTSTFNYTWTLSNIPVNTTYAILSGITENGTVNPLSFQFNLTNLSGLQTYLNALGIGTFVVTNPSGQTVQIVSNANPNNLSALTYKISTTTFIATQATNAAGFVAISANQVVQLLINYLCGLKDNQLQTSQDYTICYVDPITRLKVTVPVLAGTSLSSFLSQLVSNECKTVDYVTALGSVTCANIQSVFPQSVNVMSATDYLLGTKAGGCARIFPVEFGIAMLGLGSFDQTFVNSFCALVEQCAGGKTCAPYTLFQVQVISFNDTCPLISDFNFSFSGTTLNISQFIFGNTPLVAQTITIEYRVHNSGSYTLLSNTTSVATNGTPTPTPSIAMSAGVSYDVRVHNNCSSPAAYFIKTVTAPGSSTQIVAWSFGISGSGASGLFTIKKNGVNVVTASSNGTGSFTVVDGDVILTTETSPTGTATLFVQNDTTSAIEYNASIPNSNTFSFTVGLGGPGSSYSIDGNSTKP